MIIGMRSRENTGRLWLRERINAPFPAANTPPPPPAARASGQKELCVKMKHFHFLQGLSCPFFRTLAPDPVPGKMFWWFPRLQICIPGYHNGFITSKGKNAHSLPSTSNTMGLGFTQQPVITRNAETGPEPAHFAWSRSWRCRKMDGSGSKEAKDAVIL